MKRKGILGLCLLMTLVSHYALAEDHLLPFKGGTTWTCTQGTYLDPDNTEANPNDTHNLSSYEGKMKYALDFGLPPRTPIIASKSGTVTFAGWQKGWGNVAIINNNTELGPSNEYGRYAHQDEIIVEDGDYVVQGEMIGYSGNTGFYVVEGGGQGYHLHYQLEDANGQSLPISFVDAEETDRVPKRYVPSNENPSGLRHNYTSMNTYNPYNNFRVGKFANGWRIEPFGTSTSNFVFSRPFVLTYHYFGSYNANSALNNLGHPTSAVHQGTALEFTGYDQFGGVELPWIQDITNTSGGESWLTLAMNPFEENPRLGHPNQVINGVVYPIHGQIRNYWRAHFSDYGYPACNEYWWPNILGDRYVVQWFEKSLGVYEKITYDTQDGSFNDPETDGAVIGNHVDSSIWENVGCPKGVCGVGGYFLAPPYNLQAGALSDTEIQLTWTLPVTDTENYNVRVYDGSGNLLKDIPAADSVAVDGLEPGREYCFRVSLVDNVLGLESVRSEKACAFADAEAIPPPQSWSVLEERLTAEVGESPPHDPGEAKHSYEKAPVSANYWAKVASASQNLSFEWRLYYVYENTRVYDAQAGGPGSLFYVCDSNAYYDTSSQEYAIWHEIEANSLPYVGQYRAELWINGQKAANSLFDLTLQKPSILQVQGVPTKEQVVLSWAFLGSMNPGAGVELFRDSEMIKFTPGVSTGWTDTWPIPGEEHEYRVRTVETAPAGIFRSPFSDAEIVQIPGLDRSARSYGAFLYIGDLNANGSPELLAARLDENSGLPKILTIDLDTEEVLFQTYYLYGNCEPRRIINYGDLNGNGYPEIGLFAYFHNSRITKLEIRDLKLGWPYTINNGTIVPVPNGFTEGAVSATEANFCWNEVPGAVNYKVFRQELSGLAYLGETGGNCFTDTTVSAGNLYRYIVRACIGNECSENSQEIVIATPGIGTAQCPPGYYVDFVYCDYGNGLKLAALGHCLADHSPVVYIIDMATGTLDKEITFLGGDYSPNSLDLFKIGPNYLLGVWAINSSLEQDLEIRYIPSGELF